MHDHRAGRWGSVQEPRAVGHGAQSDLAAIRAKILPVLTRHRCRRAGLFGSAARGDMHGESDIDILVELPDGLSLIDVCRISREMEEALGHKVDLVEYATIKPALRRHILAEEVRIL